MGLVTNRHSTSRDECSAEVAGLLHIRSTPRKAEVAEWGYDLKTGRGKRDWCATCMLCALLVVCAITVSGLTSSVQLIYVQADVCETREASLSANQALMRNITNYYESRKTASATVNVTATAYYEAKKTYNSLETRYEWPAPYELDEDERQALETEAREGGDDCETVEDCVGGIIGWIGGVVGEDTCVGAEVPCPDIESTDTLVEYDASQSSINLFGNVTSSDYNKSLAQSALDQATVAITELVRRINFASSIYVLYLAFLVVVTPPFVVYGARWKHRVVDCLANVNKPMWIAFVVLVWYAHEFFQSIISSSLYNIIWANFLKDPCWADPEFLTNTSVVISNTCKAITSAENLFNQASANYRYYEQVENTWWAAIGDVAPEGPFYGDPETELIQTFPGNCSAWVLLNAIQPSDGSVNWFSLFFHSGALVALLLQVVLAHWFISWFSVLRPLTMHRGRVMVPEASEKDAALYKEVHDFARARSILPFAISTLALVFLLVNLGASSSDRGMWKKVLIAAIVLALFQFVIVPLLIWRPRDESLTSTKPQGHDDYDEDKKEDGGGGNSFPPEGSEELIWDRSFALRSAAVAGECIEKSSFRVEHSLSSVGNGDLRRDSSASFKEAQVGNPPPRDVPVKKPPTSSFFDRLGFGTSSSGQPDRLAPSDNMSNRARAIQARHSQTGKKKPDIAKPGRFSSWKSSISESARRMQPIGNGDASAAVEEGHTSAGHMRTEGSLSDALQAATAAIEAAEAVATAQRTKTRRK